MALGAHQLGANLSQLAAANRAGRARGRFGELVVIGLLYVLAHRW
jgi:hypothetical protein